MKSTRHDDPAAESTASTASAASPASAVSADSEETDAPGGFGTSADTAAAIGPALPRTLSGGLSDSRTESRRSIPRTRSFDSS
ncbi:hypothetical protein, partial [Streptomyces lunaelactis]|uniref:hypothetical protein n=1 Tax=Streptomyces lunaelactis TaxID=1535768 RepID=UPI001C30FDFB